MISLVYVKTYPNQCSKRYRMVSSDYTSTMCMDATLFNDRQTLGNIDKTG